MPFFTLVCMRYFHCEPSRVHSAVICQKKWIIKRLMCTSSVWFYRQGLTSWDLSLIGPSKINDWQDNILQLFRDKRFQGFPRITGLGNFSISKVLNPSHHYSYLKLLANTWKIGYAVALATHHQIFYLWHMGLQRRRFAVAVAQESSLRNVHSCYITSTRNSFLVWYFWLKGYRFRSLAEVLLAKHNLTYNKVILHATIDTTDRPQTIKENDIRKSWW